MQTALVDHGSNKTRQSWRKTKPEKKKKMGRGKGGGGRGNTVSGSKNKVLPFSSIYHRKRVAVNMKGTSGWLHMRWCYKDSLSLFLSSYIYMIYIYIIVYYHMTLNIIAAIYSQCSGTPCNIRTRFVLFRYEIIVVQSKQRWSSQIQRSNDTWSVIRSKLDATKYSMDKRQFTQ